MTTRPVLTVDASSLSGIDFSTYISTWFAGVGAGSFEFYGGSGTSAFGSTYYVSGSQILIDYADQGNDSDSAVALLEGDDLAYDFLYYGSSYGHGISGTLDSLTFGDWVDGVSSGTQGTGEAGRVSGLDAGLVLDGFALSAAPGDGHDAATNPVYALFAAVRDSDADAIYDVIAGYSLDVTGSARPDQLVGYLGSDTIDGGAGNDRISAGRARTS